jgi:alkanesulfonate monooxygenase SsuD/methylene tetrahydromethanopterin reductase-like flavin-dependent oxidoreductase (luciferase family)
VSDGAPPVRVGVTLPSFVRDPELPLTVAVAADEAGLDGVFAYDHLFRRARDGHRRPALEAVALLGQVAAATHRTHVGALVFRAWLRPAASLAAAVATLSRIAPGRVIAAIGAGDSQSREENETFGLGFGTVSDRVARLDASIRAVGEGDARVWVGGTASSVLDVTATSADGWNAWGTSPEEFGARVAGLRAVAVRHDFECSWGGLVVVGRDDEAAAAKAERLRPSAGTIVGGPATVADRLRDYVVCGADWVIAGPVDATDAENAPLLAEVRERLRA